MEDVRALRNYFCCGLFSEVLEEAKSIKKSDPKLADGCDIYSCRALCETNPSEVFKQVGSNASMGLQAVKLLATYKTTAEDSRELVFDTLKEWFEDAQMASNPTLQLIAAQIYYEQGNLKEALSLVADAGEDMEK